MEPSKPTLPVSALLASIGIGTLYGLFLRLMAQFDPKAVQEASKVMTLAFLVLGPFAVGFVTIYFASRRAPRGVWLSIFLPWISLLLATTATALCYLEGSICIAMSLPLTLPFASLGGVAAALLAARRRSPSTLACVLVLPLLLAPVETHLAAPVQRRTVHTEILIHASAPTVWSNIERVRPIAPAELSPTWTHRLGFPRPLEATLSFEGVGGVRHATFEHGLLFLETITEWDRNRVLAFTIQADTAHIPPTTLDEHVTIGGRYFDVLDGQYTLEPLSTHDVLLHLSSTERLSTDFNGYAGLWSDTVMRTLQNSILQVIKRRCEATA